MAAGYMSADANIAIINAAEIVRIFINAAGRDEGFYPQYGMNQSDRSFDEAAWPIHNLPRVDASSLGIVCGTRGRDLPNALMRRCGSHLQVRKKRPAQGVGDPGVARVPNEAIDICSAQRILDL
jgi:hypothetical protein